MPQKQHRLRSVLFLLCDSIKGTRMRRREAVCLQTKRWTPTVCRGGRTGAESLMVCQQKKDIQRVSFFCCYTIRFGLSTWFVRHMMGLLDGQGLRSDSGEASLMVSFNSLPKGILFLLCFHQRDSPLCLRALPETIVTK